MYAQGEPQSFLTTGNLRNLMYCNNFDSLGPRPIFQIELTAKNKIGLGLRLFFDHRNVMCILSPISLARGCTYICTPGQSILLPQSLSIYHYRNALLTRKVYIKKWLFAMQHYTTLLSCYRLYLETRWTSPL